MARLTHALASFLSQCQTPKSRNSLFLSTPSHSCRNSPFGTPLKGVNTSPTKMTLFKCSSLCCCSVATIRSQKRRKTTFFCTFIHAFHVNLFTVFWKNEKKRLFAYSCVSAALTNLCKLIRVTIVSIKFGLRGFFFHTITFFFYWNKISYQSIFLTFCFSVGVKEPPEPVLSTVAGHTPACREEMLLCV